ncbi:RNA polymerase sigma factor [Ravibacter arvi]|uniref:RNA polymerase sigma factor n=1 Tax=Ravibacter arvi TaxID=2051041 RepID=A0ABP8MCU3_9BACT
MGKILQLFSHETQLIRALRARDPKAQRLLFEKFSGRMMTVCVRYVGDRMTAEDILVQGFMKIFDAISQFREEGSFEGWMRRIMVNEALAFLRQQRRLLENADLAEAHSIPDYQYADEHLHASEIIRMIEKLPLGYRTVFNLYAIEGFTHMEIAKMLGITESTSKSQLHRARASLQEMVAKWEADSGNGTNLNDSLSKSI